MVTMTSLEAQNGFGKLLDTAQREPVAITRHGRPAAFVLSPRDMEELLDGRRKRQDIVAEFEDWRIKAMQSMTPAQSVASAALTEEEIHKLVHESR